MKTANELEKGDALRVWWKPGVDIITEIVKEGNHHAAIFAIQECGMTLEDHLLYEVVAHE